MPEVARSDGGGVVRRARHWLVVVAGLGLAGCDTTAEIPGELEPVQAEPLTVRTAPVRLDRVRSDLRRGAVVGTYEYRFARCYPYRQDLYWGEDPLDSVTAGWARVAHEKLAALGVTVPHASRALFDDMARDSRAAAYLLGGVVTDLRLRACAGVNMMSGEPAERQSGVGRITVRWQLYSTRRRAVVYRATTSGAGRVRRRRREGVAAIAREAFLDSLARLTTRADFRAAVRRPDGQQPTLSERVAGGVPKRLAKVVPLSDTPVREQVAALRRSVVRVAPDRRRGGGFFVTPRLVLTRAQVVRGASAVTLQTSDGTRLRARVLRKHAERDVALLRTRDGDGRPLPIRTRPVASAATVFAVTKPGKPDASIAVAAGTVRSGRGRNRHGMPLIQADFDAAAGSAGAPLLDATGNVVGLAASGGGKPGSGAATGFIPIRDALARLDLGGGPPAGRAKGVGAR